MSLGRIDNRDFVGRIKEEIAVKSHPIAGMLELTYQCNFNCVHCYIKKEREAKKSADLLSFKEIKNILDQLADQRCLFLALTGGEPLMRKDFKEIYLYARKKAFLISICTNAYYLSAALADFFEKYPPYNFGISFHAVTPKAFKDVTGDGGNLERSLRGINHLRQRRGLRFFLRTVVMKQNYRQLPLLRRFAQTLHVPWEVDLSAQPILHTPVRSRDVRLAPHKVIRIEQNFIRNNISRPVPLQGNRDMNMAFRNRTMGFVINPYGKVRACVYSLEPIYDLRKESFSSILRNFTCHVKLRNIEKGTPCEQCNIKQFCLPCPACRILEFGQAASSDYLCRLARYRSRSNQPYITTGMCS